MLGPSRSVTHQAPQCCAGRERAGAGGSPLETDLLGSHQPQDLERHLSHAARWPLGGCHRVKDSPPPPSPLPPSPSRSRSLSGARVQSRSGDARIRPKGPGGRARRGGPGRGGARGGGGSGAGGVPGWVGTALTSLAARLGPMDALCGSGELGSKFWVRRCLGSERAPRRASEAALGRGPSGAGRVRTAPLRAGPSGRPGRALPCPPPPRGGAGTAALGSWGAVGGVWNRKVPPLAASPGAGRRVQAEGPRPRAVELFYTCSWPRASRVVVQPGIGEVGSTGLCPSCKGFLPPSFLGARAAGEQAALTALGWGGRGRPLQVPESPGPAAAYRWEREAQREEGTCLSHLVREAQSRTRKAGLLWIHRTPF